MAQPVIRDLSAWDKLQNPVLFWDTDRARIKVDQHAQWLIPRVLQFGHIADWQVLFRLYTEETICDAVKQGRNWSERDRRFWLAYFEEDDPCIRRS